MNTVLNADTIRSLVSPTGKNSLVNAIYVKQLHKIMVGLSRLRQKLLVESPQLVESSGFGSAFEALAKLPTVVQQQIFTYPSIGFWLDIAQDLVRRRAHLLFPEFHIQVHLADFRRFVLAGCFISGSDHDSTEIWTNEDGIICLPATGIYLDIEPRIPYQRLFLSLKNRTIEIRSIDTLGTIRYQIRKVPQGMHIFELNGIDPDLRLYGRTSFSYEKLTAPEEIRWKASLESAWKWVSWVDPLLTEEIALSLKAIVPVLSAGPDIHASATFREAPGLMALSWTPNTSVMVEAVVHEYHHQKLNALLNLDDLINGPTNEAIYYSPWRTDSRPLLGILHGTYVFQAVLEFWHKVIAAQVPLLNKEYVQQRMHLIRLQTQMGLDSLDKNATWTPLGRAFFEAMTTNWTYYSRLEPIREASWQQIVQRQEHHKSEWEARNGNLAKMISPTKTSTINEVSIEHPIQGLGISTNFEIGLLKGRHFVTDDILSIVIHAYHNGDIHKLEDIESKISNNETIIVASLTKAHINYVLGHYQKAAESYYLCLFSYPNFPYFWHCFAFSLRHMERFEDANYVLGHMGQLVQIQKTELSQSIIEKGIDQCLEFIRNKLDCTSPK